jgi:hypothetical protein
LLTSYLTNTTERLCLFGVAISLFLLLTASIAFLLIGLRLEEIRDKSSGDDLMAYIRSSLTYLTGWLVVGGLSYVGVFFALALSSHSTP